VPGCPKAPSGNKMWHGDGSSAGGHKPAFPVRAVELIAHRGANREAPENTLAAFTAALEIGVDGIELDVHATADGVPVVHHDATLPGVEPAGRLSIARTPLAEVRARVAVATLDETIDLVQGRCHLYIEMKAAGAVDGVVARLSGREDWCSLHSFDHRIVARAAAALPRLRTGILIVGRLVDTRSVLRATGARDMWQHVDFVDDTLVNDVHAAGGRVIAWTVNGRDRFQEMLAAGVDGVCTDDPRELLPIAPPATR
jgi:glycerophosphoryl diester phosphodiesterase